MPDGREHRHVEAALGDQDLSGVRLDTGNRAQQLDDLRARLERELDSLGETLQCDIQRVDVRKQLEGVTLPA